MSITTPKQNTKYVIKERGPGYGMCIKMQMKPSQKRPSAELTLDLLPRSQLIRGTLPKRLRNCNQKEEENQVSMKGSRNQGGKTLNDKSCITMLEGAFTQINKDIEIKSQ